MGRLVRFLLSTLSFGAAFSLGAPCSNGCRRASPPLITASATDDLSSRLLELSAKTDVGVSASAERREELMSLIEALERAFRGTDCFKQPDLLFRRTQVVYVGEWLRAPRS